jgi:2-phospho-L-lactate guanylyltransferase (CobY/MobA/RfbA family)
MADFPLARTCNMARKQFAHHEAVSAVVPGEGGYSAAVAVKALDGMGAPQFHKILDGQKFKTASDADDAATLQLELLADVDAEGQLTWAAATN